MAVRVGPFQRIVGFNWPSNPYVVVGLSFSTDVSFASVSGSSPVGTWTPDMGIAFEFLLSDVIGYSASALDGRIVSGMPDDHTLSGAAWEYVVQATGVGSHYANEGYILGALSGGFLTDGPDFDGEKARTSLSLSVTAYRTKYGDGTPTYYSNLSHPSGPRLALGFPSVSDSAPTLSNTEVLGEHTFDFSGVTMTQGLDSYHPVGLHWKELSSYSYFPADAREIIVNLVMKKDPA